MKVKIQLYTLLLSFIIVSQLIFFWADEITLHDVFIAVYYYFIGLLGGDLVIAYGYNKFGKEKNEKTHDGDKCLP